MRKRGFGPQWGWLRDFELPGLKPGLNAMIVRRASGVLHLITQPNHAALAGRIMRRWRPLQSADRRAAILLAIEEHDNGWRELDEAPMVDPASGNIFDFVEVPAKYRQAVWPRGIARLSHEPWSAALVAQHALTVYDRFHGDPEWRDFFATIAKTRDALLDEAGDTETHLAADYPFVRIGDLISLIFCNQWESQTFGEYTFARDGDEIVVTPDPFGGERVPIAVTACEIPDRPYSSDAELRQALRDATTVSLTGTVAG
jgi:hypothetical protein